MRRPSRLTPLSEVETAQLIAALLDQAVLPVETQRLILERAGGNPLYAEEFVRMLRDRDLVDTRGTLRVDAEVPFPDSIQALIAARLDTLVAGPKGAAPGRLRGREGASGQVRSRR